MRKLALLALILSPPAFGQLEGFSKQQLIKYTARNPFERFRDGRPKVPDRYIQALKGASAEAIWSAMQSRGFLFHWEGGWKIAHPEKKLAGRAFTAQFMPARPDVNDVIEADAKRAGLPDRNHTRVIDMLQPGDVLIIDLFGKIAYGSLAGDNLTAAILGATGNGFVIDGGVRDLDGILEQNVAVYFRDSHVLPMRNVMLTGVNVPIRLGSVTVMPGDVVVGDSEGVTFIPPELVAQVAREAQETELKDMWTKAQLATGKYKSSQLYPATKDPGLQREYEQWLVRKKKEMGLE